jgi:serine/threonine protein kinase
MSGGEDEHEQPGLSTSESTWKWGVEADIVSMGFVPSLPAALPENVPLDPLHLKPGQKLDDYRIAAILGRGGFGVVYLAWQESLGRQIALKIAPAVGQEGRTLARLDHPHIVRVYSESTQGGQRLLCMQYVPSAALDDLLTRLEPIKATWAGRDLLQIVDSRHNGAAAFDPEQLADRQKLAELDHADAVCWIVGRLADALSHAHRHGVLHRDLKPGNVLISQYGRPMLVDFNLANVIHEGSGTSLFGGTLPYMAPEHLAAFAATGPDQQSTVTEASDLYSLGVILFELYVGRRPFETRTDGASKATLLREMAETRRDTDALWTDPALRAEPTIRSVLQRTLKPETADRWQSAEEMSRALGEVADLRRAVTTVSTKLRIPGWIFHHPFLSLAVLGLVPHFLGSLFNIPYNLLQIVGPDRQPKFFELVNVYNILVYPGCVWLCFKIVQPIFRHWKERWDRIDDLAALEDARRRVLRLPIWTIRVALLGWLPGTLIFPIGLHLWAGPLTWGEIAHLQLSVLLSALIALTYSTLGVLFLVTCVYYPALWIDPAGFRAKAGSEVQSLQRLIRAIPVMAGAIPLVGAVLLISASPQEFTKSQYLWYRILTVSLIANGMIGFQVAVMTTRLIRRAVAAFSGRSTDEE